MKLFIAILFLPLALLAQLPPAAASVQNDPAGACSRSSGLQYNVRTGQYWGCQGNALGNWTSGVWTKVSPANTVTTGTANPAGAACDPKSIALRTPGGALYTCANGVYAASGGGLPTGSGNKVVATPSDGSSGVSALRALVGPDIPPTFGTSLGYSPAFTGEYVFNGSADTQISNVIDMAGGTSIGAYSGLIAYKATATPTTKQLGYWGFDGHYNANGTNAVEDFIIFDDSTGNPTSNTTIFALFPTALNGWTSGPAPGGSIDTGGTFLIGGQVATNLEVAAGGYLKAPSVTTGALTVATLPATPVAGQRAFVTDSNAASFTLGIGAVVAAGGSTGVPVVYDGANWRIG